MDVFDLVAKIRLDSSEYEKGVGDAKGKFSTLATGVKNGLATVAKVGAAAVSVGVAGVAALTKMGVDGYKSYEQLSGGAKLLWGEAYDFIADKAKGAYATVQMSQNDYLQQVNGFSVGLKTAMGGNAQAAAELADKIITAEADIIAATGATQENVQNAFNGIMKNNFSMVDNLGLGITATKEGFQTMIDSVNAYNAAHGKSTKYTIDNVADCQAALVDYVAMQGMTGYAGMEAAKSIEGSVSMTKAAWQNLVVGMADSEADMEVLISNFVESTATAARNLLPRIEQTLKGIGQLITALAPVIAEALPVLIESVLPSLLAAGVSLIVAIVNGCITALPGLYTALLEGVQVILVQVFGVSEQRAGEFADGINSFFVKIKDGFLWMVEAIQTDGTVLNDIWTRLQQAFELVKTALEIAFKAVSDAFTWCVEQVNTDGTWLNEIWNGIITAVKLFQGLLSAAFDFVSNAFKWCVKQINTEGTALNTIFKVVSTVAGGAFESIKTAISAAVKIIQNVIKGFTAVLRGDWSSAFDAVKNIAKTAFDAVGSIFETGKNTIKTVIDAIKGFFDFEFTWPKLKMPHFGISPKGWEIGDLLKGTIPKLSIDWYRKAYDRAMVLSSPTIFGYSNGSFLGGGDGNGNEIVAGESHLMGLIGKVVDSRLAAHNARIIALLSAMLDEMSGGNSEIVRAIREDKIFAVGEREFARLVKTYA